MALTPLSLQNYNFSDPDQAKQYQYQMMQFLNGLISQFNTLQGQVTSAITALTPGTSNLGALAANTNFDAKSSMFIGLTFTFSVALTLGLQDVPLGAVVVMNATNSSAAAKTLTMTATTPGGVSYTVIQFQASAINNLITGQSYGANAQHTMAGMAIGTTVVPTLYLVGQ